MRFLLVLFVASFLPLSSHAESSYGVQAFSEPSVCQNVIDKHNEKRKRGEFRKIALVAESGVGKCLVITLNEKALDEVVAIEEFKTQYLGGREGWVIKDPKPEKPLFWILAKS